MAKSKRRSFAAHAFTFPRLYDALLKLAWGRSEDRYREILLDIAGVAPGDSVLDVGCGTGTQAIAARVRVGNHGYVAAIDSSPQMLSRARTKAAAAGADIKFCLGSAERLPGSQPRFDAILCATVFHCLAQPAQSHALSSIARMMKPTGRLLVVDYGGPVTGRHSLFGRIRAHQSFDVEDLIPRLARAGLSLVDHGSLEFADLHFLLAGHRR